MIKKRSDTQRDHATHAIRCILLVRCYCLKIKTSVKNKTEVTYKIATAHLC